MKRFKWAVKIEQNSQKEAHGRKDIHKVAFQGHRGVFCRFEVYYTVASRLSPGMKNRLLRRTLVC